MSEFGLRIGQEREFHTGAFVGFDGVWTDDGDGLRYRVLGDDCCSGQFWRFSVSHACRLN